MKQDIYKKRTDVIVAIKQANELIETNAPKDILYQLLFPFVKVRILRDTDIKNLIGKDFTPTQGQSKFSRKLNRVNFAIGHDFIYNVSQDDDHSLSVSDKVDSDRAHDIIEYLLGSNIYFIAKHLKLDFVDLFNAVYEGIPVDNLG